MESTETDRAIRHQTVPLQTHTTSCRVLTPRQSTRIPTPNVHHLAIFTSLDCKNLSDVGDVRQPAVGPDSRISRIVTHYHTINRSLTAVTVEKPSGVEVILEQTVQALVDQPRSQHRLDIAGFGEC